MFKKRSGPAKGTVRKRQLEHGTDVQDIAAGSAISAADEDDVVVMRPEKKERTLSTLVQSVKSSSGRLVRQTLMEERAFAASGTAASLVPEDMGATASNEIDTEHDRDRLAVLERSLQLNEELSGMADDKIYRGQAAYTQYLTNKDKETGATTTSKIKPDVCKDYKETGYCGYGDSCKFMHDRGDYKSGWQIDREWEKSQNQRQEARLQGGDSSDEAGGDNSGGEDDDLPFACLICRKEFKRPVITKCKHYFCESCAIKNFTKSPKCFACGAATAGIFMPAKELAEKLVKKHEQLKNIQQEQESDD